MQDALNRPEETADEARVGPNAILQVAAALRAAGGEAEARRVFEAAGLLPLLAAPPTAMTRQSAAAALHLALRDALPEAAAERIQADAGRRTADYLLANRIPRPAQWLLKALPGRLAAPILLKSIRANAWTFAGSGRVTAAWDGRRARIEILDNPLATPGCPWHVAVFERLFRNLVDARTQVAHPACCARGALHCRFEIIPAGVPAGHAHAGDPGKESA